MEEDFGSVLQSYAEKNLAPSLGISTNKVVSFRNSTKSFNFRTIRLYG